MRTFFKRKFQWKNLTIKRIVKIWKNFTKNFRKRDKSFMQILNANFSIFLRSERKSVHFCWALKSQIFSSFKTKSRYLPTFVRFEICSIFFSKI